ncbi:MAG: glutamate--tRNA ligase [Candidatus Thermoplasmatota archaeon]|nr:glutamate--tRNA ligase [Candidatus Thermoplasmatota archaeon]
MLDRIRVFALQNAIEHGGRASIGSVMGRAMSTFPELKGDPKGTSEIVKSIVQEVNEMDPARQEMEIECLGGPERRESRPRNTELHELPGVGPSGVRMRFAPGPSGPLHIGHSRASILNDEYVKRYGGSFILRYEDTNPEKIEPEAYRMIREDLQWLDVNVHETYIQSDRFESYYAVARELLKKGRAYICLCEVEDWRGLKLKEAPCPHRDLSPDEQLERWDRMLGGEFIEGGASLVVKTDLSHRNPAVRDFIAMRLLDALHPLKGDRYRVYPLYNFSVAVDDHMMGCTHVLRGKDHLNNTLRQEYVFHHMGWSPPHFHHYGLVSIPDTNLKKSMIKEDLKAGRVRGWDDVRLGTLRAMEARGIQPEALRRYWLDVGTKPVDIEFSWDNLSSYNRTLIDPIANRFFFVADPVVLTVRSDAGIVSRAPLHPDHPERGYREMRFEPDGGSFRMLVPSEEASSLQVGSLLRLKDLCNIKITSEDPLTADLFPGDHTILRGGAGRIIQWCPEDGVPCTLRYPDREERNGIAERAIAPLAAERSIIQFERIGFFRLYIEDGVMGNFAHR